MRCCPARLRTRHSPQPRRCSDVALAAAARGEALPPTAGADAQVDAASAAAQHARAAVEAYAAQQRQAVFGGSTRVSLRAVPQRPGFHVLEVPAALSAHPVPADYSLQGKSKAAARFDTPRLRELGEALQAAEAAVAAAAASRVRRLVCAFDQVRLLLLLLRLLLLLLPLPPPPPPPRLTSGSRSRRSSGSARSRA